MILSRWWEWDFREQFARAFVVCSQRWVAGRVLCYDLAVDIPFSFDGSLLRGEQVAASVAANDLVTENA